MGTIIKNGIVPTEQKVGIGFWIAIFGGRHKGIFRQTKNGIQLVKITGIAFMRIDNEVKTITGIKGSVHPMKTGGTKIFKIWQIRVNGEWILPEDILSQDLKKTGHTFPGLGVYFLDF